MSQGVFGFQYEVEKNQRGMTALGGLPMHRRFLGQVKPGLLNPTVVLVEFPTCDKF